MDLLNFKKKQRGEKIKKSHLEPKEKNNNKQRGEKIKKSHLEPKDTFVFKTVFRSICDGIYVDTLFIRVAT